MNQQPIDPYAPPECSTPLPSDAEILTEDAYADGKYLLIKQGYQFPPICPKTGQEIDTAVIAKKAIQVIHPIKWKDRPMWLTLFRLFPLVPLMLVLLDRFGIIRGGYWVGAGLFILIILSLIILIATAKLVCPRYTMSVYFSKSYLKRQNARKMLYGFLAISVIPLMYVGSSRNAIAFMQYGFVAGIIVFAGSLFTLALIERHFTIVRKREEYLCIKGVHSSFLANLPQAPLGLPEEHTK